MCLSLSLTLTLIGDWYARSCGLEPVLPESKVLMALSNIHELNVEKYAQCGRGAVNGMRPAGNGVQPRVEECCLQASEVSPGVTFSIAAEMIQVGMLKEAWSTAQGIDSTKEELGYHYMTPVAWDLQGSHRDLAGARSMSIWAMQHALERRQDQKGGTETKLARTQVSSPPDEQQESHPTIDSDHGSHHISDASSEDSTYD